MTLEDLKREFTARLFPRESTFVAAHALNAEPDGMAEVGDLVHCFGFPALVTERIRSLSRGVPDRFVVTTLLPASLAQAEFDAGRFAPVEATPMPGARVRTARAS